MSKIAFRSEAMKVPSSLLTSVKSKTGIALGKLKSAISQRQPFLQMPLFANDHENVERVLLDVLDAFEDAEVGIEIYELADDEELEDVLLAECEIDAVVLRRILSEWHMRDDNA